ncbi:MAG: (E)-4-hydroxy-3-methylbut-2-enyl-diphosphate synthase [Leptospiraceae bacterium]|nr:(E)-4-hydroxy-3-methylbut-2-enyl-diphosphate synthase [Leptospiraceae bacterium]MCB1170847.1 (E)-4-hydroxy-3-methylbut-2-enyl-diphosphate synthase [Leptospiraceae bacterium]
MSSAVNTDQIRPFSTGPEFQPEGNYVDNPFQYARRLTREVMVGSVGVGGNNPIRVQSMTVAPTLDTEATVKEAMELFDAGCEIVRITAQGPKEARNLENIRKELTQQGYNGPLVADIHFSPRAALTAVEYVEKVRINPGNFADTKMFAVREYTEEEYEKELERIHESFKPLVLRARQLGRSMRIGVNHGSLSDRIMNRYGDTPRGMVESAIEFIKIAELYDFKDIIVSMKASNPQVMIQAYRMLVERFRLESMDYPLHLGVTEAGDGKDGRMKSACGIGALLEDGLGDTIRVSLTEDAVKEIPVARALADLYNRFRDGQAAQFISTWNSSINVLNQNGMAVEVAGLRCPALGSPYQTVRRKTEKSHGMTDFGGTHPVRAGIFLSSGQSLPENLEGLDFVVLDEERPGPGQDLPLTVYRTLDWKSVPDWSPNKSSPEKAHPLLCAPVKEILNGPLSPSFQTLPWILKMECSDSAADLAQSLRRICELSPAWIALQCADPVSSTLATRLAAEVMEAQYRAPLILFSAPGDRASLAHSSGEENAGAELQSHAALYRTSIHSGGLLLNGLGDGILIDAGDPRDSRDMALDLLQTTRIRLYRTEYISCPSCGRTLFDLQETTARIKSKTGHLKGVKIAVMGCVVNGPGEMADADFGYVGSAPGKINLYRGKEVVRKNIPTAEADQALIDLIREHNMWQDP